MSPELYDKILGYMNSYPQFFTEDDIASFKKHWLRHHELIGMSMVSREVVIKFVSDKPEDARAITRFV